MTKTTSMLLGLSERTEEITTSLGYVYLRRFTIWQNPRGSCRVHQILLPDEERHLHDHPWAWSASVILSGGYQEDRRAGGRTIRQGFGPGTLNVFRPGDYHRIASVLSDTWTLFLTGPKIGEWGFLVDGVHIHHEEYKSASKALV